MAATATRITVSTTATLLATGDVAGTSILLRVPAGGVTVSLGESDVTTSSGFDLTAGETLSIDLDVDEELYGIVATGTQSVHTLANHVNSAGAYPYA